MFVKERPKSQFEKFQGSADKIINDLVKMGPKGLKDNEGKLAAIIDNLSKNNIPIDKKSLKPPVGEKNVHVHIKRVSKLVIKPNSNFQIHDGGSNFNVDKTKLIFAFFMASYKLDTRGSMAIKLNLSGRELPESRQLLDAQNGSLSGAFAEVYYPNGKAINLNLYYKTREDGKIADEENYVFGAITMPAGAVFKHVNSQTLTFKKSKDWSMIPNFELSVNFKDKNEFYFLIFYNLSLTMENKSTMGTRLVIDRKPYPVSFC